MEHTQMNWQEKKRRQVVFVIRGEKSCQCDFHRTLKWHRQNRKVGFFLGITQWCQYILSFGRIFKNPHSEVVTKVQITAALALHFLLWASCHYLMHPWLWSINKSWLFNRSGSFWKARSIKTWKFHPFLEQTCCLSGRALALLNICL